MYAVKKDLSGAIAIDDPENVKGDEFLSAEWPNNLRLGQTVQGYVAVIQEHMDKAAKSAGYDDIKTAVTYADEPAVAKFQVEGQTFRTWRSLVWAYSYEQLALVQGGKRQQPTIAELLAELPQLELPHD